MPRHDTETITRAKALRRDATAAEAKLWQVLRNRQLHKLKFTRQFPIGPYFADLCCRSSKLVIEIDGVTHETPEQLAHDAKRSAFLAEQGYRVIRFRNEDVFGDLSPVLEAIIAASADCPAPSHASGAGPNPLPKGEREK
jgi:very-short-patch-repair endonuclease